jgi:1,4-alpha-glucan branching enzyme
MIEAVFTTFAAVSGSMLLFLGVGFVAQFWHNFEEKMEWRRRNKQGRKDFKRLQEDRKRWIEEKERREREQA